MQNTNACDQDISKILSFLETLRQLGNVVYWYDAITKSGKLDWQNCLSEQNKPFYDCCGNIFTNYCWDESKLSNSIKISGGNLCKIFVGIDCFGRGCPGDGKLNCNFALKLIEKAFRDHESTCVSQFSIALFAPGWCYQSLSPGELLQRLDSHTWLFYNLMAQYLQPWLDGRTIFRQLPDFTLDKGHDFQTNFGIGQGTSCFVRGVETITGNYNWLMDQNLIPTGSISNTEESGIEVKMFPVRTMSYHGYGCMKIFAERKYKAPRISLCPMTVELFRMGCHTNGCDQISLKLVLGYDIAEKIPELWTGISLVITFNNIRESRITTVEFVLDEIRTNRLSASSKVEWHSFKIPSLGIVPVFASLDGFTIRKLSLRFVPSVLEFIMSSNIYLGFLRLKTVKTN